MPLYTVKYAMVSTAPLLSFQYRNMWVFYSFLQGTGENNKGKFCKIYFKSVICYVLRACLFFSMLSNL